MSPASRDFQIFCKPASYVCNLGCGYCYYLAKSDLFGLSPAPRMSDEILERYIKQHLAAHPGPVVNFSWHGGEPTILGLDYFKRIVELQRKHRPKHKRITNGMQTNGTLLDDKWGRFLARERFAVGISLDGPAEHHDQFRRTKRGEPTHKLAMRGYELLRKHQVPLDILCVLNSHNVRDPLGVYDFFRRIGGRFLSFLPLVEPPGGPGGEVSAGTVNPEAFGRFLCAVFDEWQVSDIGRIKVQIFEEAARTAFDQEHSLCLFRQTCGDIPVIEHNGDFYSCDHFVTPAHRLGNIQKTGLADLLDDPRQLRFGQRKAELPPECVECEVLDMCRGECPKNRFAPSRDGQNRLNYLCAGYKMFFRHCTPFVQAVARQWRAQNPGATVGAAASGAEPSKVGRNQPCPCGSGKKYKQCCLKKGLLA